MIRKFALSGVAIAAMTLGSFGVAEAQSTPTPTTVTCSQVGYNGCIAYPSGGFGGASPTATSVSPTSAAVVSADTVTATTGGDSAIAFTGAESRVLGYAGLGLIGFGAVALVAARRRSESELD